MDLQHQHTGSCTATTSQEMHSHWEAAVALLELHEDAQPNKQPSSAQPLFNHHHHHHHHHQISTQVTPATPQHGRSCCRLPPLLPLVSPQTGVSFEHAPTYPTEVRNRSMEPHCHADTVSWPSLVSATPPQALSPTPKTSAIMTRSSMSALPTTPVVSTNVARSSALITPTSPKSSTSTLELESSDIAKRMLPLTLPPSPPAPSTAKERAEFYSNMPALSMQKGLDEAASRTSRTMAFTHSVQISEQIPSNLKETNHFVPTSITLPNQSTLRPIAPRPTAPNTERFIVSTDTSDILTTGSRSSRRSRSRTQVTRRKLVPIAPAYHRLTTPLQRVVPVVVPRPRRASRSTRYIRPANNTPTTTRPNVVHSKMGKRELGRIRRQADCIERMREFWAQRQTSVS